MGFLILAYRKLTLRRKIDHHQSKLMDITREIQRTEEQASIMQQGTAARKELMQQKMAYDTNNFYMSNQYSLFGPAQAFQAAQRNFDAAKKNAEDNKIDVNTDPNVQAALKELQNTQGRVGSIQMDNSQKAFAFQQQMLARSQYENSIFDNKDEINIKVLKAKETRLNQEKESLESMLKLEEAEYQSVEKAEDKEAQRTAPKFGLS